MTAKMGRPKSDNPKSIEVKVRIDEQTNRKISDYCDENNVSRSDVLREGINMVLDKKEK